MKLRDMTPEQRAAHTRTKAERYAAEGSPRRRGIPGVRRNRTRTTPLTRGLARMYRMRRARTETRNAISRASRRRNRA